MVAGFLSWMLFLKIFPDLPADLLAVPVAAMALVAATVLSQEAALPLCDESGNRIQTKGRIGVRLGL
jgi:hypothetical protein